MDKTTISDAILRNNSSFSLESSSSSDKGFLSDISWSTWIIIILLLALLGFNIFVYFAKGTDILTQFISPILDPILNDTVNTGSQIVDVSAEGAKQAIQKTADVADKALSSIQDATPSTNAHAKDVSPKEDVIQKAPINQSLNNHMNTSNNYAANDYMADTSESTIQSKGKAGWCFIGQDRGFNSCAEVGVNDTCMSGNIFPTHEMCINPSLRQ
jgi:cytoskeletal protein RodZ